MKNLLIGLHICLLIAAIIVGALIGITSFKVGVSFEWEIYLSSVAITWVILLLCIPIAKGLVLLHDKLEAGR